MPDPSYVTIRSMPSFTERMVNTLLYRPSWSPALSTIPPIIPRIPPARRTIPVPTTTTEAIPSILVARLRAPRRSVIVPVHLCLVASWSSWEDVSWWTVVSTAAFFAQTILGFARLSVLVDFHHHFVDLVGAGSIDEIRLACAGLSSCLLWRQSAAGLPVHVERTSVRLASTLASRYSETICKGAHLLPIERLDDLLRAGPLHEAHLRNHRWVRSHQLA